jgi:UDP-N-acetylglucosamine--N-acetylmuramyl-(pentapeptide) pyrophosphoryl-undecaprenol N-acetylglucosamine transferase
VVATARALQELSPEVELQFFATPEGIEGKILLDNGFSPVEVAAERIQRGSLLRFPGALLRGTWSAYQALKEFAPRVVVAGGGFVSPPVALAARWLGIPLVLLEPNSVGGRANRVLSHLAQVIITGHPSAAQSFPHPKQVECLGIPMAFRHDRERGKYRRSKRSARLVVGVLGGSLGARILNQALWENYPKLGELPGLEVIHISGARDHDTALIRYQAAGEPANIQLRPFQKAMDQLYEEADLLVSRAGAMTCYELVEFELPALLVPRALSHGDHQTKNALPLKLAGAAEIFSEAEFSSEVLLQRLQTYLSDPGRLRDRRQAYQELHRPPADIAVAQRVLNLAGFSPERKETA